MVTGKWSGGNADIKVATRPFPSGPRISVSADDVWTEVLLAPRDAVRLAHELLTHAARESEGIAQPMHAGWQRAGNSPLTGWLFGTDILT